MHATEGTFLKPARIRLVDLGFDDSFDASMAFAQSLIQSLVTEHGTSPIAEVEFIRTRDYYTVATALQSSATVIHVMAHGDNAPDALGFWSDDEKSFVSLADLAEIRGRSGGHLFGGTFRRLLRLGERSLYRGRPKLHRDAARIHWVQAGGWMARIDDFRLGVLRGHVRGSWEGTFT